MARIVKHTPKRSAKPAKDEGGGVRRAKAATASKQAGSLGTTHAEDRRQRPLYRFRFCSYGMDLQSCQMSESLVDAYPWGSNVKFQGVIPANAGIQDFCRHCWMPAFAGMTILMISPWFLKGGLEFVFGPLGVLP
jgi:hypothetical protein